MAARRLLSGRKSSSRGSTSASPAGGASGSDPSIDLLVSSVSLSPSFAFRFATLLVELDLPGEGEADAIKSPQAAVRKGTAKLEFRRQLSVSPGSDLRTALISALENEKDEDSAILFVVFGVDAAGKSTELGEAEFSLAGVLKSGKDAKNHVCLVADSGGVKVAELKCSVTALAAMRVLAGESAREPSSARATSARDAASTQLALTPARSERTDGSARSEASESETPRRKSRLLSALSRRSGRSTGPGPDDAMIVSIASVTLAAAEARARFVNVQVELDLPGEEEEGAIKTAQAPVRKGVAKLDYYRSFDMSWDSEVGQAVADGLRDEDEEETTVIFAVMGVEKSGKVEEVGTAELSLVGLLKSGKDVKSEALAVNDGNDKKVGELKCSVTAVAALQQLQPSASTALVATGSSRSAKDSSITVRVASVSLSATELKQRFTGVLLELDMPGDSQEDVVRTPQATFKKGSAKLKYTRSFELGPESEMREALTTAVAEGDEKGGMIALAVMGLDASRKMEEVGTAQVSLVGLLKSGKDVKSRKLAVSDSKGNKVGEVKCSVIALAALKPLQRATSSTAIVAAGSFRSAKSGGSERAGDNSITVAVASVSLSSTELKDRYTNVLIELDMPGESQDDVVRTPQAALKKGSATLKYTRSFELEPESEMREALATALAEGDEEEGMVLLAVMGVDASGKIEELGAAQLSLVGLFKSGKDVKAEALAVTDSNDKKVGELKCSVTALAALQQLQPSAPSSALATPVGSERGGDSGITVAVSSVSLSATELKKKYTNVLIELDMPGDSQEDVVRTPQAALKKGLAKLKYTRSFELGPESEMREALTAAVAGGDEVEGKVLLAVMGVDSSGKIEEAGAAELSLLGLLKSGKDVKARKLAVNDSSGNKVGEIKCSVTALAALRRLQPSAPSSALATPVGSARADDGSITVAVSSVSLTAAELKQKYTNVLIELDMPGESQDDVVRTPQAALKKGSATLKYTRSFELGPESEMREALATALAEGDEEEGMVLLAVMGVDASGKIEEVGAAQVSLVALLKSGKDGKSETLAVNDSNDKKVGELKCSVTALAALLPLLPTAPSTALATPVGSERGGDGSITVAVSSVSLSATELKQKYTNVLIELDMPGDSQEDVVRTPQAALKKGLAKLKYTRSFELGPETEMREALTTAVVGGDEVEGKILLAVMGVDPSGKIEEAGAAELSLLGLLKSGKDVKARKLAVNDSNGNKVGEIKCSVTALAALKSIGTRSPSVEPAIVIDVRKLELDTGVAPLQPGRTHRLRVSMMGLEEHLSDVLDIGAGGVCTVRFVGRFGARTVQGGKIREALQAARGSDLSPSVPVTITLEQDSRRGKNEQLATASFDLLEFNASAADGDEHVLPLTASGSADDAGRVTVAISADELLGKLDSQPSRGQRDTPASGTAGEASLGLRVSAARLGQRGDVLVEKHELQKLWVEARLPGRELPITLAEKTRLVSGRSEQQVLLEQEDTEIRTEPNDDLWKALQACMRAAERDAAEEPAEIEFHLLGQDSRARDHDLGVALFDMLSILREGQDQVDAELVAEDENGERTGTLTVTIRALSLLRAIEGKPATSSLRSLALVASLAARPAAAAPKLSIAIKTFKLGIAGKAPDGSTPASVLVEIDLPGEDDAGVVRTPSVPVRRGTAKLEFEQAFELEEDGELNRAITAALRDGDEEASTVLLAVMAVDAQGEETELGVARCSLLTMLRAGKDVVDEARTVADDDGKPIGELLCSVTALRALKQVGAPEELAEPRSAGKRVSLDLTPAKSRASRAESIGGAAVDDGVLVVLKKLVFGKAAKLEKRSRVEVVVEVPGFGSEVVAAKLPKTNVLTTRSYSLAFTKLYDVRDGSNAAVAFAELLASASKRKSSVAFVVRSVDKAGAFKEVGVATCHLPQLLKTGADVSGTLSVVNVAGTQIGEIVCSVKAVAVLKELMEPPAEEAGQLVVAYEGAAADGGAIAVSVKSVSMSTAALKHRLSSVLVEVDMPGAGDADVVPTRTVPMRKGVASVDFEQSFDAGPDTTLGKALIAAMQPGGAEQDAQMLFALMSVDGSGASEEVGVAQYDLAQVLKAGKDVKNASLAIRDADEKQIGEMKCSIAALDALRLLQPALPPPPPPKIVVDVATVTLTSAELKQRLAGVVVELDMPGGGDADVVATPQAVLSRGVAKVNSRHEFEAEAESELWQALGRALREGKGEEGELLIAALGVDKAGKSQEVGLARCDLAALLKGGKELQAATLALTDDGGKKVGEVKCSVTALEALRAVQASLADSVVLLEVSTLTLNSPPTFERKQGNGVFVTVDMLGAHEVSTQKRLPDSGGRMNFNLKHPYATGPSSLLRENFLQAWHSNDAADTDVVFRVRKADAAGVVELGKARCSLKAVVQAAGRDPYETQLSVRSDRADGRGIEIGRLACSISAAKALLPLTRLAAQVLPISVQLLELTLSAPTSLEVVVEIDMLGLEVSSTPPAQPRAGVCQLEFSQQYDFAPGSELRSVLANALLSSAEADEGEMHLLVKLRNADGVDTELGVARCSLRGLLGRESELRRLRLPVHELSGGQVGEIVCSISGIRVVRQVQAEAEAAELIELRVQAVDLSARRGLAALKPLEKRGGAAAVVVKVAMIAPAEPLESKPAALGQKRMAAVDLKHAYSVAVGEPLRQAVSERLEAGGKCAVMLEVFATDASGRQHTRLGVSSIDLMRLLDADRDLQPSPLPILDANGAELGRLTCAATALATLRTLRAGMAEASAGRELATATGDARMQRRRAEEEAARRAVVLQVGECVLEGRLKRRPPDALRLAVDFLGGPEIRSPSALPVAAGRRLDFGFAHTLDASVGSAVRDRITDALASLKQTDAVVFIRVLDGEDRELGCAEVDVHELLSSGADLRDAKLRISTDADTDAGVGQARVPSAEAVGTLSVTLQMLPVLREVDKALKRYGTAAEAKIGEMREEDERKKAPPPAATTASSSAMSAPPWATPDPDADRLRVKLTDVKLSKAGFDAIDAKSRKLKLNLDALRIEVDLLGLADNKQPLLTQPLSVYGDGEVEKVSFERTLSTAPGTKARAKLLEALESRETEDSDVWFVLHALELSSIKRQTAKDSAKQQVEIASGFVNLEEMLSSGDLQRSTFKLTLTDDDKVHAASMKLDVEATAAVRRAAAELRATRIALKVHRFKLLERSAVEGSVDAIQIGVAVLGLEETFLDPLPLLVNKSVYDFEPPLQFSLSTKPEAPAHAELLRKLRETAKEQQAAVVSVYAVKGSQQQDPAAGERELLSQVSIKLHAGPEQERATHDLLDGRKRTPTRLGQLELSLSAGDAVRWLLQSASGRGGEGTEYLGKQEGLEGVWRDGRRVQASDAAKRGIARLRGALGGGGAEEIVEMLRAVPSAYASSVLHRRQALHLNSLAATFVRAASPAGGSTSARTLLVEIGEIRNAPMPPRTGGVTVTRRSLSLCVVRQPDTADASTSATTFVSNVLTVDVRFRAAENVWELPSRNQSLLLRCSAEAGADTMLLLELNLTVTKAGGSDAASAAGVKVLTCGWAVLPLAQPLESGSRVVAEAQTLLLSGGNIMRPAQLRPPAGSSQADASKFVANPPAVVISASTATDTDQAEPLVLPDDVIVPRQLSRLVRAVSDLHRSQSQIGGVGAPNQLQVALRGFAKLSEAPDTLWLLLDLWEAQLAAIRSARRGQEPTRPEQAEAMQRVLASAPLLASAGTASVPGFHAPTERLVERREEVLDQISRECERDPLRLLCQDDPVLSIAPVRISDLLMTPQ